MIPKKNTQNVIRELIEIEKSGQLNEFTIKKYTQKAKQIIKTNVDIAGGYTILGILFALQGKAQDVRESFDNAIRLNSSSSTIYMNYSLSLLKLGYLSDSFEVCQKAAKLFPSEQNIYYYLVQRAVVLGKYNVAQEYINKWFQSSKEELAKEKRIIDFALQYNLDEAAIQEYIMLAISLFQRSSSKFIFDLVPRLFSDESGEWIRLSIYMVDISVDNIIDMTFELAQTCANSVSITEVMRYFLVSYHLWEPST